MITVTSHNPHTVILSMCVKRELNVRSSDPHTVILSMCVKRELNVSTCDPHTVILSMCVKRELNILKEHDIDVPADGRTLLKTPRSGSLRITEKSGDCLDDNNESPDDSYLNSSQPNPVFLDLNTKILQQIQMLEQRQAVIMNDLAKVKSVLMKRAEEDAHEELFKQQQCSSFEKFEAFCQRLEEDKNYRELYVHYLIHTHGSSNIGEMVRQALKSIASDNVLCLYNRTGKDGKKVLPPVLLICLKKCVRSFHKQNEIEVKKLKVTTRTTPDAECIRQVDIFFFQRQHQAEKETK
ncbi:hypothetical protein DPX16_23786 [Anabarilius grahami]|uniref:Uncharacterized protein n=1 Tax=Anabarilius grahami TaxID=495550 RepID=A0A3N0Z3V1_ANAGA|nr:hypothetical protein DPX16_23786 [Anabarilius grahami]